MVIQDKLLTPNKYSRRQKPNNPKMIVMHYVGNPSTSALANRNYFESLKAGLKLSNGDYRFASSHVIIGLNGEIIRCIPDNEEAIHASDSVVNVSSIGVEMCHPDWTGKFNEATVKSAIEYCADICKTYNLNPLEDIVRHFDIPKSKRKDCPRYWVAYPSEFEKFKKDVLAFMSVPDKDRIVQETVNALVNAKCKDGKTPVTTYPESWKAIFNGTQTTKGEFIMTLVRRLMKLE